MNEIIKHVYLNLILKVRNIVIVQNWIKKFLFI
jgi:hypothetical protein